LALGMSHNTWVHLIVRPIMRPLAKSRVTPNHLTAMRLATAVASGLMLTIGDRYWSNAAGAVFLISLILDRADGELARLSGKSTPWGHRFDLISDYSANVLIFLGMGIGLRGSALGPGAIVLGLLAGFAITSIFWLVSRVERFGGAGSAAFPTAVGFDPDDAMLVVPVAIWLNGEQVILIAAAIGAPAFLLWAWWRFRRYLAPS
jgi:archaetidylinositol phosphate synthase